MTSLPTASLFVQLRTGATPASVYRRALEITVAAEELGYGSVWFATRHFAAHHAALPSVFPFLVAAAARTRRIRLGAGVVALPFEHPVRVAEDAAVTDELADGRLELGVGKGLGFGLSASAFAAFGVPPAERESRYRSHLTTLQEILGSGRVGPDAALYPPPGTLRRRIWQSTGSIPSACAAARAGDGLLPHGNSESRGEGGVGELVDAYLSAWRGAAAPRIGLTVAALPGRSPGDAIDLLRSDAALSPAYYAGVPGDGLDAFASERGIDVGGADGLTDRIRRAPGFGFATDLLVHLPLALEHPRYLECLERAARLVPARLTEVRRACLSGGPAG
ncbi:putative FMN-dependent luciferase-like monooxygenase [Gordonia sinesedis]